MKGKKKRFIKPVVLGFGVMYFMVMVLSTWLVKEKFVEEYNHERECRRKHHCFHRFYQERANV